MNWGDLSDWLRAHDWGAWLGLAIILGGAEMLSLDLVLGMLAIGAVAGMLAALVGFPGVAQVLLALGAAAACLALIRPSLLNRLHTSPTLRLGHDKLVGEQGVVTEPISVHAAGRVRVGGEVWSALPYDERLEIPAGATVEVFAIRGATALVHPIAELGDPTRY